MFCCVWVLSLCLLWNYTNGSAFIFNASLFEQQPQEVWLWSKVTSVPVLPESVPLSPRFALRLHGAETSLGVGQGWHHSAEGPTSTSATLTDVQCPKGSAASLLAESPLQNKVCDLDFQHLQQLHLDAANCINFSVFPRESQKGGHKPSRYLKHLVDEGGQKEMGWVSLGRLG